MPRTTPTTPAPTTPPVAVAPATATPSSTTPNTPTQDMKWYFYTPWAILLILFTWWSLDTHYANKYGIAPPTTTVPLVPPLVPTGPVGSAGTHLVQVHRTKYEMVKENTSKDPVGKVTWFPPGDPDSWNTTAWVVELKGTKSKFGSLVDTDDGTVGINTYLADYGLKIKEVDSSSSTPTARGFTSLLSEMLDAMGRKIRSFWDTP